ncbi:lipopolysaccharide biosynthesis protein [Bacteroidaceae bacterium HV4-6-C5C]|nr:lipopolysaccharide biosynthesis protein [Bacteroidaceae bacterium HV4-6-C5C]
MQERSLKTKAVKGVAWSFLDNIASSGITFLIGLILARLLTPEEYGIMAMITIFIAISNSIVDSGFSSALIRKTDIKPIDYNTVFYFNLVVSFVLYCILYVLSPSISIFFKEPILIGITRVIGCILIINALAIIPRTIFVRQVDFKTQTKVSIISSVLSGVVGVGMALSGMGVWSLVGQQLARQLLNTFFLWIYCKWKPLWEFSISSFKEMFGFGSKLLLSGLLDTIYNNIYYLVIGRFYSSAQLGQYTRSEQFNSVFSSNLTSVVQRVSYPVLSSIQDEPKRIREAYRKIIRNTMLVTFACMLGLAAVAKPLIIVLIGEKWSVAASYLSIICFSGMLYPLHAINLNILQVKGRSDLFLKLEILKKIIAIIPIILGVFWGIETMLWSSFLISCIAYLMNSYYSSTLIGYSTQNQIKDLLPSFFISFFVAICMWGMTFLKISAFILLPLQCLLGIFLAIFIYEKMKLDEYIEIKKLLFSVLKRK